MTYRYFCRASSSEKLLLSASHKMNNGARSPSFTVLARSETNTPSTIAAINPPIRKLFIDCLLMKTHVPSSLPFPSQHSTSSHHFTYSVGLSLPTFEKRDTISCGSVS